MGRMVVVVTGRFGMVFTVVIGGPATKVAGAIEDPALGTGLRELPIDIGDTCDIVGLTTTRVGT